jgi:hypothetical protein
MPPLTKTALHKHLKELSEAEKTKLILDLFSKYEVVKKHFQMELATDTTEIVQAYKDKIRKHYFPARGFGDHRSGPVRKLVSEFRKISVFDYDLIDLIFYRVEQAIEFTNAYGDIDPAFYESAEGAYDDALKLIEKNGLHDKFRDRCRQIVLDTENMGWGFYDQLYDLYTNTFGKL